MAANADSTGTDIGTIEPPPMARIVTESRTDTTAIVVARTRTSSRLP